MQKITPFLWFDRQAEEAAKFYTSLFKNAKIGNDVGQTITPFLMLVGKQGGRAEEAYEQQ